MKTNEDYMGLDALGHGILVCISDHQCLNGSVPADPEVLANIVRATPEQVRGFLSTFRKLKTLAELEGGPVDRLVIPFLHRELKAVQELIEGRRQAGAKGGKRTQTKARQAQQVVASSSAQPRLDSQIEHSSTIQEKETYKDQRQRNIREQQHLHRRPEGFPMALDADDDGADLPTDLRNELTRLGIAANLWSELCAKADGPLGLRRALDLLEAKTKSGEIRSPSGFLLHCVTELAQEAKAHYEEAYNRALHSDQAALMDPRWVQLPEVCRGSLEILRAWCEWWDLQEQVSTLGDTRDRDLVAKASEMRITFLEACLCCHPDRTEINAALTVKLQSAGDLSKKPMVAKRLRVTALEGLLGLSVKASPKERPPV